MYKPTIEVLLNILMQGSKCGPKPHAVNKVNTDNNDEGTSMAKRDGVAAKVCCALLKIKDYGVMMFTILGLLPRN